MNWKFLFGKTFEKAQQAVIRSNSRFINKNFPYGRDWMFDAKRALKDVSLIVDAGANVGSISIDLNFWFPGADIYAFEPVKNTFKMLENNVAAKDKIHAVNMGLGTTDEQIQILLNNENSINSLKITEVYDSIVGSEEITITRLDGYLENLGRSYIDILKIDVEGFEFEVLAGCGALITNNIKCIYLEVGYSREPTKVHFSDVEVFMEKNGFELCGIYETRRNLFDKRRLWYSNNLYIKKSLLAG